MLLGCTFIILTPFRNPGSAPASYIYACSYETGVVHTKKMYMIVLFSVANLFNIAITIASYIE